MRIKVCHLTSVHRSNDIRIFKKMCRSLVDFGYEVHLVVANAATEIVDSVIITGVPVGDKGRAHRMVFAAKAVYQEALKIDADIYHIHDPELLPWAVKLQRKGKKVIYDSHEDVPQDILDKEWLRPAALRKILASAFNTYEKRQVQKLSGVISVLDSITEKFHHRNSVTIHNFPRLEYFGEGKYDFQPEIASRFKLVYNGGLTRVRGIHQMVTAISHLDDHFVLLIMGPWESEVYRQECIATAGWDRVVDMGVQDISTCMQILKASDLGMLIFKPIANHLNSLPNKSFEYLAAGIPALMSNFEFWMKEFGTYARFVDPEDPIAIAEKIRDMADNYEAESERALMAASDILQVKTWEHEAQKLNDFYTQIIQSD